MANSMQVVQYTKYNGGVKDLETNTVLIPLPGSGEVLIKVEATSLNPVDWKIQNGKYKPLIPLKFPYIPCSDVAGEVIKLGPDVSQFKVGDKVVTYIDHKRGGGLAEYAIAEVGTTAKLTALSSVEAAALPVAALTALGSLRDSAGVKLDGTFRKNILISAASGGVGTYAVQLAKLTGARVVATCGGRNVEMVRELGADEVLDYRTPEGREFRDSLGTRFDVIIHCATGIPLTRFNRVLRDDGVLVDVSPKPVTMLETVIRKMRFPTKKTVPFYLNPTASDLKVIIEMMEKKQIRTVVDSVHHISCVKDAWMRCIEGHATGKIIVVFN